MANEKYGFIIHPDEWRMARDVLDKTAIADALFPVLDACLLEDDPSEAIGEIVRTNLCARIFWDRNVRDIDRYKNNREAANERKRKFREAHAKTERQGTDGNAVERNGTERNGWNAPYTNTDTDTNPNTNSNSKSNTNTKNINRTESVPPAKVGSGSARDILGKGKATRNWWTVPDDEIRCGCNESEPVRFIYTVLAEALGKGAWRKAVAQAGNAAVTELFLTFRAEIRAGEACNNYASAFTARLQRDLGVDFSLDYAASVKRGQENGVT